MPTIIDNFFGPLNRLAAAVQKELDTKQVQGTDEKYNSDQPRDDHGRWGSGGGGGGGLSAEAAAPYVQEMEGFNSGTWRQGTGWKDLAKRAKEMSTEDTAAVKEMAGQFLDQGAREYADEMAKLEHEQLPGNSGLGKRLDVFEAEHAITEAAKETGHDEGLSKVVLYNAANAPGEWSKEKIQDRLATLDKPFEANIEAQRLFMPSEVGKAKKWFAEKGELSEGEQRIATKFFDSFHRAGDTPLLQDANNKVDFRNQFGKSLDLEKYSPDQPRDDHGRFSSGGGGGGGAAGSSGMVNPDGKDTMQQYRNPDGSWSPERQKLHDEIVSRAFEGTTPVDNPVSYMTGGGPASGKSHAMNEFGMPENTVLIDSDAIKKQIPEYQSMSAAGDAGAAAFAHEESSYLSKRILAEGIERGHNTMLDGTGDSDLDSLRSKVEVMRRGGREVVANYVTVDTEVALARNLARAQKTGRLVPEAVVRGTHASVSRVAPAAVQEGLFDRFSLWDTSAGGKAIKVASAVGKDVTVHDQGLWDKFVAKGQ